METKVSDYKTLVKETIHSATDEQLAEVFAEMERAPARIRKMFDNMADEYAYFFEEQVKVEIIKYLTNTTSSMMFV